MIRKYLLKILILLSSLTLYSNIPPKMIDFQHYTTNNNLENGIIYDIVQDKRGFIWVSTGHGISRFDGYTFKNYIPDGKQGSIMPGPATNLFIDSRDRLWVGVINGGLNLYNEKEDTFKSYLNIKGDNTSISGNGVFDIDEDMDGNIWVTTINNGLNMFDEENDTFVSFKHNKAKNSISSNKAFGLYIDKNNTVWVSTIDGGLNEYRISEDNFYHHIPDAAQGVNIYEDSSGLLWITSIGTGVYTYDRKKGKFTNYRKEVNTPGTISHNQVIRVLEDSYGTIWLTTWGGGLNFFNKSEETFKAYRYYENNKSINSDDTWGLFEDNTGVLWVGTYGSGINKYDRKTDIFKKIKRNPLEEKTITNNKVKSILKTSNNELWLGSIGSGIDILNHKLEYVRNIQMDGTTSSIPNNNIWALDEDINGNIWIATENGLVKYNMDTNTFNTYYNQPDNINSISNNIVRTVFVDNDNNIWTGSQFGPISRYNEASDSFIRYQELGLFNSSFYQDYKGTLWFGNTEGLFYLDSSTGKFEPYLKNDTGESIGFIVDITGDKRGNLWIGLSNGLLKLDINSRAITQIKKTDGLLDQDIGSIEVYNNYTWVSTSRGVSRIDIDNDKIDNFEIMNFTRKSSYMSDNGNIFMGGTNGVIYFNPNSIKLNNVIPKIVLTDFKIFNKTVVDYNNVVIMDKIDLSYKDNFFSFEFSALDYSDPLRNKYKYKLEGFDKDWIDVPSSRRFGSYTNLDGGSYILKIIGSNSDNIWNDKGIEIAIDIKPPFTDTNQFKVLVIISGLLLFIIIYFYITKLRYALKRLKKSENKIEKKLQENSYLLKNIMTLKTSLSEIINSMPSILVCVDSRGRIKLWNNKASETYKKSNKDVLGQNICKIIPGFIPYYRYIFNSIKNEEILSFNEKNQQDDDQRFKDITIYPYTVDGLTGAVIRIDDITEQVKFKKMLIQNEKLLSLGQLVSGLAHEIKNPIGGIIQSLQLITNRLTDYENDKNISIAHEINLDFNILGIYLEERKITQFLKLINTEGERVLKIVKSMLNFSRQNSQKDKLLNLVDILDKSIYLLSAETKLNQKYSIKNITIDKKIGSLETKFYGNETEIEQVFMNIIRNAIQAMEEHETNKPKLDIEIRENKSYLTITISDNGPGMSSEIKRNIFEPFFTTKKAENGTGIGLSVSYQIICEHYSGNLEVISEVDHGSSFIITLPITKVSN